MKINSNPIRGAALVALLVGLSPAISAGSKSPGYQSTSDQAQQPATSSSERMQQQQQQQQASSMQRRSAHELTGMDVKNRSGDSLGKVKDFVIDANSGQVVYAVVGSGGVLGIGETLHAVPVSALNYDSSSGDERLTLDIDSARWAQAPRFRKERLSSLQAEQEGKATFEYYGQTWREGSQSLSMNNPVRNQGQGTSASQQQPAGRQERQFVLASDIIGKNIRSGSQKIGSIEDVLVQLQNGTAAVLLDPDNDFAGTDQKYIVPFNKLTLSGSDLFATSLTREDFSSAQVAQGDSWASTSGSSGRLYIWPSSSASISSAERSDRVAQNAQNQMNQPAQSKTAQTTPQSQQGQPPVAEIRQALQNDTSLAQQGGKNVQVIAQGDKVVLLGTVQTKEAKDRIEERVEKAAPGWSIQNEIRVANVEE